MRLTFPTPWVPVVFGEKHCALRYVEKSAEVVSEAWGGFVRGSNRPQVLFHSKDECQKQCDRLNRVKAVVKSVVKVA